MGDLSEHFNHKDFACRCRECRDEYRVHLGLVGALEDIGGHFRKKVRVVSAFWCDTFFEKQNKPKRSLHTMGKAAHINMDGISPQDLFKYAETVPELRGLVFYPNETWIHVDTRQGEPVRLVKEGGEYHPLTAERRAKYGLQPDQ
ncbi:MAG: D-Ala-D-Ala carboxypeptidase family metallohydrolase [Candidatus Margulisiibacteriota bacterium]